VLDGEKKKTVTVSNWVNCKIPAGARTIEASPDGHFLFAACNFSSCLAVIDAREMTLLGTIPADSFPVGLDISRDGRYVFTTSQGRGNQGGNSVCIFEVKYKVPPTTRHCANCGERRTTGEQKCHKCGVPFVGIYAMSDSLTTDDDAPLMAENEKSSASSWLLLGGGFLVLLAGAGVFFLRR
jgi:hypothetical protein